MKIIPFALLFSAGMVIGACNNKPSNDMGAAWNHSINFDWKFAKGDQSAAIAPGFDDSSWEGVDLPHDWAISGPFGPLKSDVNTGELPWKGEGWYRKSFNIPNEAAGKRLQFLFDGVMANPEVFLNGEKVGSWRYGLTLSGLMLPMLPTLEEKMFFRCMLIPENIAHAGTLVQGSTERLECDWLLTSTSLFSGISLNTSMTFASYSKKKGIIT